MIIKKTIDQTTYNGVDETAMTVETKVTFFGIPVYTKNVFVHDIEDDSFFEEIDEEVEKIAEDKVEAPVVNKKGKKK